MKPVAHEDLTIALVELSPYPFSFKADTARRLPGYASRHTLNQELHRAFAGDGLPRRPADWNDRNRDEDEPATGGEETTRSGLPSAGGRRGPAKPRD